MQPETTTSTESSAVPTGDQSKEFAARTPTPWRVFKTADGLSFIGVGSEDGQGVLDAGFGVWSWNNAEGMANAELAVRAVNSYDTMLAALIEINKACARRDAAFVGANPDPERLLYAVSRYSSALGNVQEAIDKAEGR